MHTKAMMLHRRYLEAYTCNTDLMRDVHSYVDSKMNCEDIAMNFLVANTNGRCPVPLFVEPLHFIGDFGDIRYAQRDGIKAPIHQRGLAIPGAGRRRRPPASRRFRRRRRVRLHGRRRRRFSQHPPEPQIPRARRPRRVRRQVPRFRVEQLRQVRLLQSDAPVL